MNKVYLVTYTDYDEHWVVSAHGSHEKAKKGVAEARKKHIAEKTALFQRIGEKWNPNNMGTFVIEEFKVD